MLLQSISVVNGIDVMADKVVPKLVPLDVYTSCGIGYYDCEPGEFVLRHDRNECTLLEAKEILESLENMC